jgi:phosphoglycerate dehydrogenase-like enzyme
MTAPAYGPQDTITVGITYPEAWEVRPRAELDADLELLRRLDPRIAITEVRYEDPPDLRVARGAPPYDGLREQAPALTPEQREAFAAVDVVLAQDLPFDISDVAPRLRMVQGLGAGVGQLVSAGLGDAGIRLATAAGVSAVSISEFAIGLLLRAWKRFDEIADLQRQGLWQPTFGRELAGSTVAVLGLGAIGSELARRLDALDVEVLAVRRSFQPGMTAPHVAELFGPGDLATVLGRADAVFAAVPETPDTVGTMDAAAFAAMRPGSFFCNVGRGSFVVEDALVDALERGHLGAAALDVVHTEPLPPESPLWTTPNLVITPHSAASDQRYFRNLYRLFRENIAHLLADEPLRNEVDLTRGY